jgi:hypothetical protein
MESHGIQRYVAAHHIPLILPRNYVNVSKLSKEVGEGGDDLPTIEWTDLVNWAVSSDQRKIYGASGQHRYAALMDLRDKAVQHVATLKESLVDAENQIIQNLMEPHERKKLEDELEKTNAMLVGFGNWGFALYDYGALQ